MINDIPKPTHMPTRMDEGLAKMHRKTPDCIFPEKCKCEDCNKCHGSMWGMKRMSLIEDTYILDALINKYKNK